MTSYVALKPPKGRSEMPNGSFPSKIALCIKKVCCKVSLCQNCQRLRALILLKTWRYISRLLTYLLTYLKVVTHSLAYISVQE